MPTDPERDEQYRATTIRKVRDCNGGWTITDTEGWSLFVTNAACSVPPKPDEHVRMYGRGVGHSVRGIVIAGRVYRYQTEQEARAEFEASLAKMKAEKVNEYEGKRAEYERRVAALPEPLRNRIEGFRAHGGDEWRHEFEPYELFVCEQGVAFAAALGSREALTGFRALPHGEQRAMVPAMSDEHSGNTFGAACALAAAVLDSPSIAEKMHGALCPLVGCKEYGCFAARGEVANAE